MGFFSFFRDCLSRIWSRKGTLCVLAALYLAALICGAIFVTTPAVYGYHLTLCDRFIDRICFSDRNVFLIFFERLIGNSLLFLLILASGIHPIALFLPPTVLVFRAYTFGGSLVVFFTVYRATGVLVVFALYLPVRLLIDAVLTGAAVLSFLRAPRFCFSGEDFWCLLRDALVLFCLVAAICFAEMLLLLILFHPMGNLL